MSFLQRLNHVLRTCATMLCPAWLNNCLCTNYNPWRLYSTITQWRLNIIILLDGFCNIVGQGHTNGCTFIALCIKPVPQQSWWFVYFLRPLWHKLISNFILPFQSNILFHLHPKMRTRQFLQIEFCEMQPHQYIYFLRCNEYPKMFTDCKIRRKKIYLVHDSNAHSASRAMLHHGSLVWSD